jgi:hypothetical protein
MQTDGTMRRVSLPGATGCGRQALQRLAWYRTRALVAICLPLGLLACAQIPVTELSGYRAAFDQAQTTSQEVLVDFDRTLVESKQRVKDKDGEAVWQPFPSDWNQVVGQGADASDPDTRVRVQAFEVIKRYNDSLGRLAEGKSSAELSASVGGLADSATQFATLAGAAVAPPLAALGPLLSAWAEQLEKARLAKEFRKALQEGAPVVNKMLDVLIADAGSHYNMRAEINNEKRGLILKATTRQLRILIGLLNSHAAPAGQFESLEKISKEVNNTLAPMGKDLTEYPYTFQSATTGTPPAFDADTAAAVAAANAELERLALSYDDLRKQMEALAAVLLNYQKLLMETKSALAALQKAQVEQASLSNVTKELIKTGFELRRTFEQYRLTVAHAR